MRVAVVYWDPRKKELKQIAEALAKGIEKQGHQVQLFNGEIDDLRLTSFQYIAMGTVPVSAFGKKIESSVINGIKRSGTLTGKRSFAFIKKKGLRSFKIMQSLMFHMEAEGLMIKNSEIFISPEEAEILGSKLHIK